MAERKNSLSRFKRNLIMKTQEIKLDLEADTGPVFKDTCKPQKVRNKNVGFENV